MPTSCQLALLLTLLLPLAAGAGEGPASAPADCSDPAVAAIQRRYDAVRDLSAVFVQTTRSVALGGPASAKASRGVVQFAKPGRMRWAYEEPEPSLVVSDGKTLWLYDPEHREVQRLAVGDGYFSGAAIQFLLGEGDIARDFRVTALACEPHFAEIELVPRRDATYERLRVRADLRTGDLMRTEVVDLLGNSTIVDFSEIRVDLDPGDEVFVFEPPEGVRVIELGAMGPPAP